MCMVIVGIPSFVMYCILSVIRKFVVYVFTVNSQRKVTFHLIKMLLTKINKHHVLDLNQKKKKKIHLLGDMMCNNGKVRDPFAILAKICH